jgi:hypothetical protein
LGIHHLDNGNPRNVPAGFKNVADPDNNNVAVNLQTNSFARNHAEADVHVQWPRKRWSTMISRLHSLRTCYGSSDIPGSSAAADRPFGDAKVISFDAARAILRPLASEHRLAPQDIEDPRDHAWREFFLRDEPSFRFEDFGGRS